MSQTALVRFDMMKASAQRLKKIPKGICKLTAIENKDKLTPYSCGINLYQTLLHTLILCAVRQWTARCKREGLSHQQVTQVADVLNLNLKILHICH